MVVPLDSNIVRSEREIGVVVAANAGKSSVPSGWYPDPNNSAINRWWSGSEWTKDVSPREIVQEVVSRADDTVRAATSTAQSTAQSTATRATSLASDTRTTGSSIGTRNTASSISGARASAVSRPAVSRPAASTTVAPNSAASYAASSARPTSPAAPFRDPARGRPAPEIMQPPYAFNRTMSTFALIVVVVGLGLIAGLLLN